MRTNTIDFLVENGVLDYFFFNCYLAAPRATLSHSQVDSLINLMLITAF